MSGGYVIPGNALRENFDERLPDARGEDLAGPETSKEYQTFRFELPTELSDAAAPLLAIEEREHAVTERSELTEIALLSIRTAEPRGPLRDEVEPSSPKASMASAIAPSRAPRH